MGKKNCEFCSEEIHINSRRCPFCAGIQKEIPSENEDLNAPAPDQPDNEVREIRLEKKDEQFENHEEKNQEEVKKESPIWYTDPNAANYEARQTEPMISNGLKVFLSVVSSVIPGVGQIIGIISAIIFMSNEQDSDSKSFGKSLLIASLIMFGVWSMWIIIIFTIAISS